MIDVSYPVALQQEHVKEIHGDKICDEYHWLKEYPKVKNAKIIEYLEKENAYYHANMDPLKDYEDIIYNEIISKIKLKDQSVPIKKDNYYYYKKSEENSNYQIFCRKENSLDAKEEIILDLNLISDKYEYLSLGTSSVSKNHQFIAYSLDTTGAERFRVFVKDLKNDKIIDEEVEGALGSVVWDDQSVGFYYTKVDSKWRPNKVYYHKIQTSLDQDKLIYEEKDPVFWTGIFKSSSEDYMFINTHSKNESEIWYIDLKAKNHKINLVIPRKEDNLYYVSHHGEYFYILTNDKGKNFRVARSKISDLKNWQEIIAHEDNLYLNHLSLYENFFVLEAKINGLEEIRIYDYENQEFKKIDFPDPTYKASVTYTSYDDKNFRINYSSLNNPITDYEYDRASGSLNILKIQEIPGGFNKNDYVSERIWADSDDNVKVPISIVYNKKLFKKDGSNPMYLYGYGSYGLSMPASFRPAIFSLLDKGFVYSIAHIRGGDDLGYKWYEDAKFLNKKRTFQDFIASAKYLIEKKYTSKGNIVIAGGSAGGMLVGYCINNASSLYKAAIAHVPFVDVLNTMLDENLPLTPGEFKEWGNPKDKEYYEYIKSYSPYENVRPQAYPNIYVTAGLNDPRVTYWEPAKWVAKLRNLKTDNNLLLLETNMGAGHAGASGRFGYYRDLAKEYNFIFKVFGIEIRK